MRTISSGFTFVELMVVIVVLAIALALAVPSYLDLRNKRAVTRVAETTLNFIAVAQTEAIKRNTPVTVTVNNEDGFCAGMDDGSAACDCHTAGACVIPTSGGGADTGMERVLDGSAFDNVLSPVLVDSSGEVVSRLLFTFDPVRGVLDAANQTSGAIRLTSKNGYFALDVALAMTGRSEICNRGTGKVGGFHDC